MTTTTTWIASIGHLKYHSQDKITVEIEEDLVRYYRSLLPRHITLNRTRWLPHITVVRNETPQNSRVAAEWDGRLVSFLYSPNVRQGDVYWWLCVQCPLLNALRVEMGLAASSEWTRPPSGEECFHITIGNTKGLT